jgi:hypothetical protein
MFDYQDNEGWDVSFGRRMPELPYYDDQADEVVERKLAPEPAREKQFGPIYGVELLERLPLDGGMSQALPSRKDLEDVRRTKIVGNDRVVAGYEVLLEHYRRTTAAVVALRNLWPAERWATLSAICRDHPCIDQAAAKAKGE